MKQTLKTLTPLLVVFTVLLSSNFINAAWSNPTATPPGDNASTPINESVTNQLKQGDITARNLKAGSEVWSPLYCDEAGGSCFTASSSFGGGIPSGAVMAFNLSTCPAGWMPANGAEGTVDLQGNFVRGLDASRALGSFQDDAFQGHWHDGTTGGGGSNTYSTGFAQTHTNPLWARFDTNRTTTGDPKTATGRGYGTVRIADETRPNNIALLFCQRS
jgi:hypothetical protein